MFFPSRRDGQCWAVAPLLLALALLLGVAVAPAPAASIGATYLFNSTLAAEQPTAPALINVNPLGLNGFEPATVYGQTRTVFRFAGNPTPTSAQGGLRLNTTGLVPTNNYSVELVFEFTQDFGTWRRVVDTLNQMSDNGFYVSPDDFLQVYEAGVLAEGSTVFTTSVFHHVVLTNAPSGIVNAYLDGSPQLTTPSTTVMNISGTGLMNFFLDDDVFPGEYANGRVALIRLWDGVLTPAEVAELARDPFGPIGNVPEPGSLVLLGLGALGLVGYRRFRRRAR